jgi:hypothetical protein
METLKKAYVYRGNGQVCVFKTENDVKEWFYDTEFLDYDFDEWLEELPSKKVLQLTEEQARTLFKVQIYKEWFADNIDIGVMYGG